MAVTHNSGSIFAAHFYAGYHGNGAPPVSEPSASDSELAEPFVQRLLEVWPDAAQIPMWGRWFGEMVAYRHQKNRAILPVLRLALQQYADSFYAQIASAWEKERKDVARKAYQAHWAKYAPAYEQYAQAEMQRHEEKHTNAYVTFERERQEGRQRLSRACPAADLAEFDSAAQRVEQFRMFLLVRGEPGFLDFTEWDAAMNPERFDQKTLQICLGAPEASLNAARSA